MSSPDITTARLDEQVRRPGRFPRGLSPSAEEEGLYARARVRWLRRCLDELGERPSSLLELGCGCGASTPYFFEELKIRSLVGVDVSREQLAVAEHARTRAEVTYVQLGDYRATESMDLAYAHGVFSGMPVWERPAAAILVFRSLKSGGLFALWENNPWHPGARFGSRHASANGAAMPLNPPTARQLLRGVGFDIVHTTSAFYFPRALSWCRPLEPMLATIPLGEQYMVLARKP
jgi:SAM-dependent methyltransferase